LKPLLAQAGVDLYTFNKVLGHESIKKLNDILTIVLTVLFLRRFFRHLVLFSVREHPFLITINNIFLLLKVFLAIAENNLWNKYCNLYPIRCSDMKTVHYLLTCGVFGLTPFEGTDRCRKMIVTHYFLTSFML